jgi:hypothetical protein
MVSQPVLLSVGSNNTNRVYIIKPTQHKPPIRVTFSHLEFSHMWDLTSICMLCFMDNAVRNNILSELQSSLKAQIFPVWCSVMSVVQFAPNKFKIIGSKFEIPTNQIKVR